MKARRSAIASSIGTTEFGAWPLEVTLEAYGGAASTSNEMPTLAPIHAVPPDGLLLMRFCWPSMDVFMVMEVLFDEGAEIGRLRTWIIEHRDYRHDSPSQAEVPLVSDTAELPTVAHGPPHQAERVLVLAENVASGY